MDRDRRHAVQASDAGVDRAAIPRGLEGDSGRDRRRQFRGGARCPGRLAAVAGGDGRRRGCFPKSWFKPLHEAAKEITSALGEVRDRDVLLEFLNAERASAPASDAPGIDRLIARVRGEHDRARLGDDPFSRPDREPRARTESMRRFGDGAERRIGTEHGDREPRLEGEADSIRDGPLGDNARRILAVRVAEFYSWEPIVDDDARIEQLHQLRISAKRLRYTLELFRRCLRRNRRSAPSSDSRGSGRTWPVCMTSRFGSR